jgi:hypothetical protein
MIATAIAGKSNPWGPFAEPRTAASVIVSTRLFRRGCRFAAKNSENSKKSADSAPASLRCYHSAIADQL